MTLATRLATLRRRFATKPNFVQTGDGVERLPVRTAHPHWIVGRGLCMYRQQDFANVPKNRRRATVELQLPVWSPFRRTGHHCVWSDTTAMVWFWDEDRVRAAQQAFRTAPATRDTPVPEDLRVVPETVFLPRGRDGVRLQRCRAGTELQHWRDGVLQDTFWFAQHPDAGDVTAFLARQGIADTARIENGAADTTVLEHAAEPWASPVAPAEWLVANERPLAAACLLVLALALVWQEARFWKIDGLASAAAAEFERQQDALQPLMATRDEIVALRRRNEALVTLLNAPSQARIMGLVDGAIPGDSARFAEWRYQQGELEVLVSDAKDLDPVAYVRALEAVPLFEAVRVGRSTRPDSVEIALRVHP